jgi:hypothetical protein
MEKHPDFILFTSRLIASDDLNKRSATSIKIHDKALMIIAS